MTLSIINLPAYVLVFARFGAAITFNPIFSRRNVPMMVRISLIVLLTVMITPLLAVENLSELSEVIIIMYLIQEIFLGFVLGYLAQMFQYMLFFVGDLLDYHFGLSMAKVFDPSTSIQVSAIGNYFQIIYIVLFFVTGAHLHLLRLFVISFEYIPLTQGISLTYVASFVLDAFLEVFMIVMKLALPFIFVQFILEVSMGILMKLIPQIHVFVINIQLKVLLGIVLLILFVQPITYFIERYIGQLLQLIQSFLVV